MLDQPGKNATDPFDIFVSHATEDVEYARRLADQLGSHGFRCFVATDNLDAVVGTDEWSEALEQVLASVPIVVVLVTRQALDSKWVTFEWRSFHKSLLGGTRSGLIVPVLLLDERDSERVPFALRSFRRVDFSGLGEAEATSRLLELVESFRCAAQRSNDPLDRALRWSGRPLPEELSKIESLPNASLGFRNLVRWCRMRKHLMLSTLTASLLVGAGTLTRARWGSKAPVAHSLIQFSAVNPLREPRRGWEAIEACLCPTLANQNFVNRAETWLESQAAFDAVCQRQCAARQRAAAHVAAGQHAWFEGQETVARQQFEFAMTADRDWMLPLLLLAKTWVTDAPQDAIEYARQAYERDAGLWVALLVKASAFAELRRYSQAILEYKEARSRAPEDSRSLVDGLIALTYHAEGRRDEKAKDLASTVCTDQVHWVSACAVLAERAIEANEPDQALAFIEIADSDDFVPLLLAQGDAFQLNGDLARAWNAWTRATELQARAKAQGASAMRLSQVVEAVASQVPPPFRESGATIPQKMRTRPSPAQRTIQAHSDPRTESTGATRTRPSFDWLSPF